MDAEWRLPACNGGIERWGGYGCCLIPISFLGGLGMRLSGIIDGDVPMFQVGSVTASSGRGCVPSGHGPSAQEGEGEDS